MEANTNINTEAMTPFRRFLYAHAAWKGYGLGCRYPLFSDDGLSDVCPQCHEPCELDGEPTCYECKCQRASWVVAPNASYVLADADGDVESERGFYTSVFD